MFKFSFKVCHKNCAETGLSINYPKHHITVVDIQSNHPKEKQYFYYVSGPEKDFDNIIRHLRASKQYKRAEEVERTRTALLLLVVLHQSSYIQNVIQKYNGFFLDLHTVYGGYEYWHVGVLDKKNIEPMREELKRMGDLKTLSIGEAQFGETLLSKQQHKIFQYAHEQGYYELPRKTTIEKIAKALKLSHATVGEHLAKAENKLILSTANKL